PDGRTLAVGVCGDGSGNNTIRLVEVATGALLRDPPTQLLMDAYTGGVHWLPDSSGFFFSGLSGTAVEFAQDVYLHLRRGDVRTERAGVPWPTRQEYRWAVISPDGRYAVAFERLLDPVPVAIAEVAQSPISWRPFLTSIRGTVVGHVVGDRFVAV